MVLKWTIPQKQKEYGICVWHDLVQGEEGLGKDHVTIFLHSTA